MRSIGLMSAVVLLSACGPASGGVSAQVSQRLDELVVAADEHQAAAVQVADDAACRAELARYQGAVQPMLDDLARLSASGHHGCRCCGDRGFARSIEVETTALRDHVAGTCGAPPADRAGLVERHCLGMRQFAMGAPR